MAADSHERELLETALDRDRNDVDLLIRLGELYSRAGRWREGLAVDLRLVALAPSDPIVRYNLACSLALTGRVDGALIALRDAVRLGYHDAGHLLADPDLARVREQEGFAPLLERVRRAGGAAAR